MTLVKDLLKRVEDSIRERKLFRRGDRILVAVSGGVDSMVLLQVLARLARSHKWKLVVAHFNHQLRARASVADEQLVKKAAAQLGLAFEAGRGDVKALAKRKGISIEMAARELRHAFLAQAARRARCRTIALAHHADDQVELFFLRMLRGAGGEGLAGMKWKTVSPMDSKLVMVRPLLNLEKATLVAFAKHEGFSFREDASNRSADILRNRVRLELLPWLRKRFHPAVDQTVARLMEIVGAEAEVVAAIAESWLATQPRSVAFCDCPIGVQRRIIQLQLQRLGLGADFELIEALRLAPGKKNSVAAGLWLTVDETGCVQKTAPVVQDFNVLTKTVPLGKGTGQVEFAAVEICWRFAEGEKFKQNRRVGAEWFDAARVGRNIILRHWRPGDRFQPIGMKAAVKLQDWFTNQKIPAARRRELVVATTERGEIFWVEGLRIGEEFKVGAHTKELLNWRWQPAKSAKSP